MVRGRLFLSVIFLLGAGVFAYRHTNSNALAASAYEGGSSPVPIFWSPDGRWIIFAHSQGSQLSILEVATESLYTVLVDVSHMNLVTNNWSPDSRHFLFQGIDGIYILAAESGNLTNLTASFSEDAFSGTWSPDGTRIAFETQSSIFVTDTDGSNLANLAVSLANDGSSPMWSPDGTHFVFAGYESGLYIVDPDGGNLTNLTASLEEDVNDPQWSPDGKRIAFETVYHKDIYVIDADGSNLINLTASLEMGVNDPQWSPDGEHIAFEFLSQNSIYVVDVDGNNLTKLNPNKEDLGFSSLRGWSLDGAYLAYHSPLCKVCVVNIENHEQVFTTGTMNRDELYPTIEWNYTDNPWSPNETKIAFLNSSYEDYYQLELYILDMEEEHLSIQASFVSEVYNCCSFDWSPDGQAIAVNFLDGRISIYYLDGSVFTTSAVVE